MTVCHLQTSEFYGRVCWGAVICVQGEEDGGAHAFICCCFVSNAPATYPLSTSLAYGSGAYVHHSNEFPRLPPGASNSNMDRVTGFRLLKWRLPCPLPQPQLHPALQSLEGDLASDDELLEISSISRQKAGVYECTAVNDIDTDVQTVDITVNYAPSVSEGRDAGVTLGQRGVLECEADAVPEADFEWYKDNRRVFNDFDDIEIVNTGSLSKLTFYNVSDSDYGNYTCVAVNKLGSSNTSFLLYVVTEPTSSTLLQGPRAVQDGSGGAKAVHFHTCLLFVAFLPFLLRF
ncbi:hypothetical protein CRENBAI_011843 [Crenichthys baileyi]|uniref:Ig-like domain-containing protein n=1 Tax=Crenichthys baileyi TaxID=28760 RepID=A0AAV9RK06_9TELE